MISARRVLVVEDEASLADLARLYLERDGYVTRRLPALSTGRSTSLRFRVDRQVVIAEGRPLTAGGAAGWPPASGTSGWSAPGRPRWCRSPRR